MANASKPKILTMRIKTDANGKASVVLEYGVAELERSIPDGHGLVRASAIFNEGGELADVEIITIKT